MYKYILKNICEKCSFIWIPEVSVHCFHIIDGNLEQVKLYIYISKPENIYMYKYMRRHAADVVHTYVYVCVRLYIY